MSRSNAPVSKELAEFLQTIARMDTEGEICDRTNGDDCMSGDDAVEALSGIIETARRLCPKPTTPRGRPQRGPEKRKTVTLRLPPTTIELIRIYGKGSFTAGVERLVALVLRPTL